MSGSCHISKESGLDSLAWPLTSSNEPMVKVNEGVKFVCNISFMWQAQEWECKSAAIQSLSFLNLQILHTQPFEMPHVIIVFLCVMSLPAVAERDSAVRTRTERPHIGWDGAQQLKSFSVWIVCYFVVMMLHNSVTESSDWLETLHLVIKEGN